MNRLILEGRELALLGAGVSEDRVRRVAFFRLQVDVGVGVLVRTGDRRGDDRQVKG